MAHGKRTNGYSNLKFWGCRRENGRVGVRNHVVILPLDDLSNAACEAVANNIKGTLALPHAYGRLQFGEDLDLHFRTLIGTGSNPNVAAVVVIGIEDQWTNRVVEGIAKTGKPVTGFGIEGTRRHRHHRQGVARRQGLPAVGIRAAARGVRHLRALGVDEMRRVRHHDRPRLLPDRRQHVRQADPARHLRLLRRDLGDHRRRAPRQGARSDPGGRREVVPDLESLSGRGDRGPQDRRPLRLAADQGQHRRRPHHHRGEGARQPREDRPRVPLHRRPRAGRGARPRGRASTTWTRPRRRPNA